MLFRFPGAVFQIIRLLLLQKLFYGNFVILMTGNCIIGGGSFHLRKPAAVFFLSLFLSLPVFCIINKQKEFLPREVFVESLTQPESLMWNKGLTQLVEYTQHLAINKSKIRHCNIFVCTTFLEIHKFY